MTTRTDSQNRALNVKTLKEKLHYDVGTGIFKWIVKPSKNRSAGDIAGYKNNSGYIVIKIDNRAYLAHRLAWLYVNGENPRNNIDHINGDKLDNRISNLRDVNQSLNCRNAKMKKNNKSSYTGVHWSREKNKWSSQIRIDGGNAFIGYYKTFYAACYAHHAESIKHGYSDRHGK